MTRSHRFGTWLVGSALAVGCADDSGDEGGADETAGESGDPCFEPVPWEIAGAPDFKNVVSGVQKPPSYDQDETYTTVAVGLVDDPENDSRWDYAVASIDHSVIRVFYGSDDPGLTVFDDSPPELWAIGSGGVQDLALADLNGDDHNELIALTTGDELKIFPGDDESPWFRESITTRSATVSGATGHSQLIVDDLNCDDDLDVIMPADDGAVIRTGGGTGLLNGTTYTVDTDGDPTFALAVGDLDGSNPPDLVATTASPEDGKIYVLLGDCNGNPYDEFDTYDFEVGGLASANPHVAIAYMCGTSGDEPGIAVAFGDAVYFLCSDGTGDFEDVQEPHGEEDATGQGFDYLWGLDEIGGSVRALASYGDHPELITIAGNKPIRLTPAVCGVAFGRRLELSQAIRVTSALTLNQNLQRLRLVPGSKPTSWRRMAVAGQGGLQVLQ